MKLLKLELNKIVTNPNQPRKYFDREKLDELKESIKNNGLIQPIVVKKIKIGNNIGKYEIIAGERRFRACCELKMTHIDALSIEVSDSKSYEYSVLENIQRENLSAIEEAESYVALMELYGYTQEGLADKLGKTRTAISNKIRLLKLPEIVKKMVKTGDLSYGQARALISIVDKEKIIDLAKKIVEKGYSVREVEKLVKKYNSKYKNSENKKLDFLKLDNKKSHKLEINNEEKQFLEEKLREFFESKVQIKGDLYKQGKIEIDFYSYEDLSRIIELFNINFE